MLNTLIKEYDQWLKARGLPKMSADELVAEENVSAENKAWLHNFIERWSQAEEDEKVGGYLITDPCYIVPDEQWEDFCNGVFGYGQSDTRLPFKIDGLGTILESDSTAYGDGAMNFGGKKKVLVDSGTVCLVALDKGVTPTDYQGNCVTRTRETADRWYAKAQQI